MEDSRNLAGKNVYGRAEPGSSEELDCPKIPRRLLFQVAASVAAGAGVLASGILMADEVKTQHEIERNLADTVRGLVDELAQRATAGEDLIDSATLQRLVNERTNGLLTVKKTVELETLLTGVAEQRREDHLGYGAQLAANVVNTSTEALDFKQDGLTPKLEELDDANRTLICMVLVAQLNDEVVSEDVRRKMLGDYVDGMKEAEYDSAHQITLMHQRIYDMLKYFGAAIESGDRSLKLNLLARSAR